MRKGPPTDPDNLISSVFSDDEFVLNDRAFVVHTAHACIVVTLVAIGIGFALDDCESPDADRRKSQNHLQRLRE
ncbi:hypothetical protein BST65_01465 [Bradyrhizobium canariense]|nr:hypothetical protein BST65_01465 [Bradyrhizobium canariense]OSI54542.1 hypothetical protein BSZ20_02380 [Bradyrhizobium canariense]OSI57075.1 hypothetical protein BST67_02345 [Bradyrhizobium canariense]